MQPGSTRLRCLVFSAMLALACASMAIIKDKPEGAQFAPNQSEEQVAAQQAHQATIDEQNRINYEGESVATPEATNEADAAAALQSAEASRESQKASDEEAKRIMALAGNSKKEDGKGGLPWMWLIVGAAGFGVVMGIRCVANRVVPEMPSAPGMTKAESSVVQPKKFTW